MPPSPKCADTWTRTKTDSALQKLGEITDEDFAEMDLVPDFDTDE